MQFPGMKPRRKASKPRGVVIGNVHDFDMERLQRTATRLGSLRKSRSDVYDAASGTLVVDDDETGLTVHHEVDPEVKAAMQRFSETARSRGLWLAVGGGILLGLLLAGMTWWFATQSGDGKKRR